MGRKASWPPRIQCHPSGQARVRIKGKDVWLGRHGSKEAAERYAELVRAGEPQPRTRALTVAEAVERYDDYARSHYVKPDGTPTSEVAYVVRALGVLLAVCPAMRAEDFRGVMLKKARDEMVKRGWCRTNTNHHVNVIKRAWKWLLAEELITAESYASVRAVEALKAGRTSAPEREKVRPAVEADVLATLPFLSPHLRAVVRLQLATACRPGEAVALDPDEIEYAEPVWLWRPQAHKTAYRGKGKLILVGPRAQEVLAPLLDAHEGGFLFGPKKSEALRRAEVRAASATPRRTSLAGRPGRPWLSDFYGPLAYTKAVARACERAGVPHWSPGRLRHLAGTLLAAEFGPIVAQTIMGHANLRTTEIYCERDLKPALAAILKVG